MPQGHRAVASHAATAIVTSPEEEPSAGSNWLQSEALGPTSSAYGTSLKLSCVFCPHSDFSAADSPQNGASGHLTAPTAAATAVEPAPSDMVKPTFTKQTVSVVEEAQLVCTASPHYVTALQVAVLGELAMGGLICPATAVAPHKSDAAGAATLTNRQAKVHYSEDAGVQKPVAPLIAARNMLADIDPLAAPAEATDPAASSPPQSSNAVDADCTVHQRSSAASALAIQQPAVAVHEPATLLPLQEDQPGVISINAQSVVDHTQASASEASTPCVLEEAIAESGLLISSIRAVSQLDIDSRAALAAEMQQQDQENSGQHPNSNQDPCTYTQTFANTDLKLHAHVAPDLGSIADPQATPGADPHDMSISNAYAASDASLAADPGAVPAMPSHSIVQAE